MKLIKAEVVTIGDEILYGQITDTNSQWISTELDKIGINTIRKSSVGDAQEAILQIFNESFERADVILVTGGLGPTKDDITKKTIAQYFDDTLIINEHALAFISDFFIKRGREMTELNRLQATIPSKAKYLPNAMGTAPGMWMEKNGKVLISMPGVPMEMKYLMEYEVIPALQAYFETPVIEHKIIRTIGIGESFLAETISDWEDALPQHIKLAYLPSFAQVKLRLSAFGTNRNQLQKEINEQFDKVMPLIQPYVFSTNNEDIEAAIGRMLLEKKQTVATAESCTGGYISHLITTIPGCSVYFMGSVVSYSNEAKMNVLGVNKSTLDSFGAVSEETVREMAEGVRKVMKTDYGVATSGIAGPDGGTEEKPVGTIWLAVAGPKGTHAVKVLSTKTRIVNIQYGAVVALNLLRKQIIRDNS